MSLLRSTYSNNIYTIYTAALLVAGAGLGTPALAQTITNPASENLRATINAALDHAPALAEARADESAARAKLAGAKAERNPKLAVDGYAGVGRIDNGGFFGFGSAHTTPYAINATGEMPLYTGGRTSAGIEQASGGVRLARLQSAQRRLTVVVEAVATYTEVLSARQLVAQYQKLTQELSEVERQSELRFKSGEIPNSDLATVHARKAEGDAGLADAEGRLTSAEAHYQQLTGTAAGNLGTVPAPPATPVSLGEALEAARRTNPILKQADVTVDVARSGVHAAKADRLPTVGAFAQAGRDYDEFFPGYHANTVMVGVRGHWALWSGGRVSSKEDAANAEVSAAQARADAARREIESAVIDAWSAYQTAKAVLNASSARTQAASEALRSAQLEAKVGSISTLTLLDAERELIQAEASEIDAQGHRLVAAWRLNALSGNILF